MSFLVLCNTHQDEVPDDEADEDEAPDEDGPMDDDNEARFREVGYTHPKLAWNPKIKWVIFRFHVTVIFQGVH